MRQIILGTAGHIDHGKTALIRTLTGIDTDRLKEEKERGITIELGFAHFTLPNGTRLGIVDVPGHEKFVHHMVAGATGMDIVALVVAADEGVMPQTIEHLEICKLLEIPLGLIVLTKIDLIDDPSWFELVEEDIREAVKGTFLEKAPIVKVSSLTGEGIDELIKTLTELSKDVPERDKEGPFRLPVDRVFTIKGFGTIVTGTSASGILSVGDQLTIYPSNITTKARNIQVHGENVQKAEAGQRVAINLQGIEKTEVNRGDVVATPDSIIPTNTLDVFVKFVSNIDKPIKHGSPIRFHVGTSENIGRIFFLEKDKIGGSEETFAQIHLQSKIPTIKGDRFILRSYSPVTTIGGGVVLDPLPKRHKRKARKIASEALKKLIHAKPEQAILWHINEAKTRGITIRELQVKTNTYGQRLSNILERLEKVEEIFLVSKETGHYLGRTFIETLERDIISILENYHKENTFRWGMPKELLANKSSSGYPPKTFQITLERLVKAGKVSVRQELVKLSSHSILLGDKELKLKEAIEKIYLASPFQPPSPEEVAQKLKEPYDQKFEDLIFLMQEEGILVRIKEDIVFHSRSIDEIKNRLIKFLKEHGEISPSQFKELINTTRKYAIPLLEFFDREKLTLRVGDVRKLR